MAQFQVSAGASRVLLGAVRAAEVLNLVVEGLECGINLNIMLPQGAGGLIGPHVPEWIRGLLWLTQTGKGRHVDARARRTRRTRGSGVTRGTLREGKSSKWVRSTEIVQCTALFVVVIVLFFLMTLYIQQDQILQSDHEVRGVQ